MRFLSIFVFVFAVLVLFASAEEEKVQEKSAEEICRQPKIRGHCRALIPKFYYNAATGECENFGYGGCGGNGNNFRTKTECESLCQGIQPAEVEA